MQYTSTRGSKPVASAEAIIAGLAPDGGLYVPQSLPSFSPDEIFVMAGLDYARRSARVMAKFLTDFTEEELNGYTERAYAQLKFPPTSTAPLIRLSDNAYILELFHGLTCAFKDFALQVMPYLLTASLKKCGVEKTVVILVATSGDTGKAALMGFSDVPGTKICVFYPNGGVSPIQRLQMVSQSGENVMVFAVDGNFDDAQNGVKRIFTDRNFQEQLAGCGYLLSSANSINWGRMVPQIAYYFSAYCDLLGRGCVALGDPVDFVVPTGNFGNIFSAYLAKLCGLPVRRLVCASNKNRVLTDFFQTGTYDRNREFYLTSSPSMDILISSNLERLLYLVAGRDARKLTGFMQSLAGDGRYTVDEGMLRALQSDFFAGFADDASTAKTIADVFSSTGYLCDTHTAVAIKVYEDYKKQAGTSVPAVIASTASPFKFGTSVLFALGDKTGGDDFAMLRRLSELSGLPVPGPLSGLKDCAVRFETAVKPSGMKAAVAEWLNCEK